MSTNGQNGFTGKDEKGRFLPGHKFKAEVPYDQKLIRDSLKTNLYRAVNFLNFTHVQAKQFLERIQEEIDNNTPTEITMLEAIVAEAVVKRKWDVIDKLFDRIIPKPPVQVVSGDSMTLMDELTDKQKRLAIEAATKTLEKKK